MGNVDWRAVLAPDQPWQVAYPIVAREVREILADGPPVTSAVLSILLYPTPREQKIRERLDRALDALATHELADCAKRGNPIKVRMRSPYGRWITVVKRPWIWGLWGSRNPEAAETRVCPHCGKELP